MISYLQIDKLTKSFGDLVLFEDITFGIAQGQKVGLIAKNGTGKTTLLNCISTIDKVTSGHIYVAGTDITKLKGNHLNKFRREELGFIFQDFNLLDTFSIQDNIFLPLVLAGKAYNEMRSSLMPIAEKLGINEILAKYPYEVSGGQKQRAAVARALITNPQMILADEPTGALDSKAAQSLLSMFQNINQEGQTILMVTHSIQAASRAGRVLFIKDGVIFNQIYRGRLSDDEMYQKISDTLTVLHTESRHAQRFEQEA